MEDMMKGKRRLMFTLRVITILFSVSVFIHIVSALTLDTIIEYKSVKFFSTNLPTEMGGYKIAFITDTHSITIDELEKAVSELNKKQPDLLILGGDYHPNHEDLICEMEVLSKVITTDGIYGVEGNHDNYATVFAAMERNSICPLSNSGVRISEFFYLAGVEDLWNRNSNIEMAIKEAETNDFVIMVAHNPDAVMKQNTKSVDLILSGHTHGGHVKLFGVWAPMLTFRRTITDYGERFMSGWSKSLDDIPVYVSNGAGKYTSVPRDFARPQIIIFTMYKK